MDLRNMLGAGVVLHSWPALIDDPTKLDSAMTDDALRIPLLAGIGLAAFANAFILMRLSPRTLMVAWTLALFFVPIWAGAQIGIYFSVITVVTILAISTSSLHFFKFSSVDALMGSFVLLLLVGWMLGLVQWGHLVLVLTGWMIPYLGGRFIASRVELKWIYGCLAAGAVAAACLAIAEFVTGTNFFVRLKMSNSLYATWHTLQFRGGLLRVEGAFGHSIALGASLAMCSVFILVVAWPQWLRIASLLVVAIATGLTFSRIGLIALALTLVVGLVALRHDIVASLRWKIFALVGLAAAVGLPLLLSVFTSAGNEASGSAEYRTDLLPLLGTASLVGIAKSREVTAAGTTYYGTFQSIDSEVVLTALRFGLLPLLILLAALAICCIAVLRGRATPASVAIVGMIPAFATVALITQYTTLVWFLAGLAVACHHQRLHGASPIKTVVAFQPTQTKNQREVSKWL
ncbi:hypothetical protein [Arthrobacter sp. H35-D1]|uniref:hypothetical protein n=1 Tax=Arthrobacter sp. H35-D1 TaxID=3046202 RepID=UPI0024B9B074|nr:hypothetical protein [Arthrobacter sp. H35-D1]MDJ0312330.1 hypothetical protein [Arthrobacter sp. H35-D1]